MRNPCPACGKNLIINGMVEKKYKLSGVSVIVTSKCKYCKNEIIYKSRLALTSMGMIVFFILVQLRVVQLPHDYFAISEDCFEVILLIVIVLLVCSLSVILKPKLCKNIE